jgi:hypothetical protein
VRLPGLACGLVLAVRPAGLAGAGVIGAPWARKRSTVAAHPSTHERRCGQTGEGDVVDMGAGWGQHK